MSEQEKNAAPQPSGDSTNKSETPTKKKHRFRKLMIFVLTVLFFWWFNNFTLRITKYTIVSDKINGDGVRIALLSDQHAAKFGITNETILKKLNRTAPDIVFMLGDMYSRNSTRELTEIPVELVSMVTEAGYPVYFVSGEHDTSQDYIQRMRDAGAHVMDYQSEIININGNNLEIFGIDNVYYSDTFDLNTAFTKTPGCFSILMAHIPNYDKFSDFAADLTVCGDTHGGIIQLPFGKGPAYYSETRQWFPEISESRSDVYDKGIFPYNNGAMLITSGIGAYPVPARLNNRPEIAVVDIVNSK